MALRNEMLENLAIRIINYDSVPKDKTLPIKSSTKGKFYFIFIKFSFNSA